jgi:hypothetical protein
VTGQKPEGLLPTRFSKDARAYVRDMEKRTDTLVPRPQRSLIKQDLKQNKYTRLEGEKLGQHQDQYTPAMRKQLKKEWSEQNKMEWPTTQVFNPKKGDFEPVAHEFHHIIPQQLGGPHKWWNGYPVPKIEHQGGVHGSGGPLNNIVKEIKK